FIPSRRLVLTGAALAGSFERLRDAIGVVCDLDCRLSAYAQPASIDRVRWIAFDLFGQASLDDAGVALAFHLGVSVHNPNEHAAAGWTQRADARLPARHAGCERFFWNESDQFMFGIPATAENAGGACGCCELEEVAAIDRHLSN